jgi:hypothetical protein
MSDSALTGSRRVLVLEPGRAEHHYWRDLWAYRALFAILAWRDVAVRYKTDRHWRRLGRRPAIADVGGLHAGVRPPAAVPSATIQAAKTRGLG